MTVNWATCSSSIVATFMLFVASVSAGTIRECPSPSATDTHVFAKVHGDPNERLCRWDYFVGGRVCRTRKSWENAAAWGLTDF